MAKKKRRASAKQMAWRKKFARLYGGGKRRRSHSVNRTATSRAVKRTYRRTENMARRKHSRRSRRSGGGFGGLNMTDLAIMGAGAGFAGFLGSQVNKYSGGRVGGNVAELVAGGAIFYLGKRNRYAREFGKGVLIKAVGDFVEDNVVPMASSAMGGTAGNNNGGSW